ncbi:tetratricopeptide repeat protein [Protaetiibacter larvae]|uniref:Tetratricopeptide repeat protein n=1 Tax=Protaetiibacter larvae TaxID=2592654 RepID=A0A5C1YB90_9MICO|nr:tetratricopeptide repeat protein [Protaetiibacter larvae]QEO10535.1 tetratricopeptide repeat protein [Protaetiibacter larvae]
MSDLPPASLRGAVDLSALVRRSAAPAPAPAAAGERAASPLVIETSDAEFSSVLELSQRVPVVVELIAPGLAPALGAVVESYGGRLVLVVVDASVNPQLAQAFQVREVPTVAAVIGGRPVSLFVGIPSDAEVRQVLDELLQLAAENGVTGTVPAEGADDAAEPVEEPLPPHHQEAYDAIEAGDYPTAIAAYRKALVENPRDQLAVAGLAQVSLLDRLTGVSAGEIRDAAAARRDDLDAQLAVADLDVSGGHLEDAFGRLLELFPSAGPADRDRIRTRLLDYFEIAGGEDPRVVAARRALAALLY